MSTARASSQSIHSSLEAVALNSLVSSSCSCASAFHAMSFGASPGR